jgi:acyl-CoA thioesterase FadM
MLGLGLTLSQALALKLPLSTEQLKSTATHIVVGTVQAIYERMVEESPSGRGVVYVAEVRVKEVEKGQGIKSGDLLYARYSEVHKVIELSNGRKMSFEGPYRNKPETGQTLRIYLARNAYDGFTNENNDGGFNVIYSNCFEKLKDEAK